MRVAGPGDACVGKAQPAPVTQYRWCTGRKGAEQHIRPDRWLAFARRGRSTWAFAALERGMIRNRHDRRSRGVGEARRNEREESCQRRFFNPATGWRVHLAAP